MIRKIDGQPDLTREELLALPTRAPLKGVGRFRRDYLASRYQEAFCVVIDFRETPRGGIGSFNVGLYPLPAPEAKEGGAA